MKVLKILTSLLFIAGLMSSGNAEANSSNPCNDPPLISSSGGSTCDGGSVTLTASVMGGTIRWYETSTSTTILASGGSYNVNPGSTTTYYAAAYFSSHSCEGPQRKAVVATINPIPSKPDSDYEYGCGAGNYTLSSSPGTNGDEVKWYSAQTGGSLVHTGNDYTTTFPVGVTTYYISTNNTSTGCESDRNPITIDVDSPIIAGSIGSNKTVCYNGSAGTLTSGNPASGGNGSYDYQWEHKPSGGSWTPITGATSPTYAPGNLTQTHDYRRKVTSGICGSVYSNTITVSVNPTLVAGNISGTTTVCYNSPSTASNASDASGGDGAYAYQWQYSTNNSAWYDLAGEIGTSYTSDNLTSIHYYRRRVQSCNETKYSNTVTVDVYSDVGAGSIGGTTNICFNTSPGTFGSTTAATGSNGNYDYQWQYSPNNNTWYDVSGATNTTYAPGNLNSTTYYRRKVTSCGRTKFTNTVTVTVYPNLTAGSINGTQSICPGETANILGEASSPAGGDNVYNFQWQFRAPGGTFANVSSSGTNSTYNPGAPSSTREYRRRVQSCGQTVYSNVITVTVKPLPDNFSVNVPSYVCYGASGEITVPNSQSGASYQLQTSGGSNIGSSINGNGASISLGNQPDGTYKVVASLNSCTRTSSNVIINEDPEVVASISGSSAYCPANPPTLTANPAGGTYQWYKNGTILSGESNQTLIVPENNSYTVQVTVNGCMDESGPKTMIPDEIETPTVTIALESGYTNSICEGGTVAFEVVTSTFGGSSPSYQWKRNGLNVGTGSTYSASDYTNGDQITCEMTSNSTLCLSSTIATSNSITVTEHAYPVAFTISIPQQPCYDELGEIVVGSSELGVLYQLKKLDNTNVGIPVAGNDGVLSLGTHTEDTYKVEATRNGCGTASTNYVTIDAADEIVAEISGFKGFCASAHPVLTASPAGATSYQWYKDGVAMSGETNLTLTAPSLGDYTVEVTNGNCSDTSGITTLVPAEELTPAFTIKIDEPFDNVLCQGELPVFAVDSIQGQGSFPTFQWFKNGTQVGSDDTYLGWNLSTGDVIYAVMTSDAKQCLTAPTATSNSIAVTINSLPVVEAGSSMEVFQGSITSVSDGTPSGGSWSGSGAGNGVFNAQGLSVGTHVGTYEYTDMVTGCSATDTRDFDVVTGPSITIVGNSYLDVATPTTTLTVPNTFASYQWFWNDTPVGTNSSSLTVTAAGHFEVTVANSYGSRYTTEYVEILDYRMGNYIRSHIPQVEINEVDIDSMDSYSASQRAMAVDYFDGLGRTSQKVFWSANSDNEDIIQPIEYDGFGRLSKQYLPFADTSNSALYRPNALISAGSYENSKQYLFYQSAANVAHDTRPYSERTYDDSPLNRVVEQFNPGEDWKNNSKSIQLEYAVNTGTDNIWNWQVKEDAVYATGYYMNGELIKNTSRDEEGHQSEQFTDKWGRMILQRIQESKDSLDNISWAETYYVYDDLGNLRFVLPPMLVSKLEETDFSVPQGDVLLKEDFTITNANYNGGGYQYLPNVEVTLASDFETVDSTFYVREYSGIVQGLPLDSWSYQFKYDNRGRIIEKKTPGAGWTYFVYDRRDRLVLTQDANQRLKNEWMFTKYDVLNRPVSTGIYEHFTSAPQSTMTALVNSEWSSGNGVSIRKNTIEKTSTTGWGNAGGSTGIVIAQNQDGMAKMVAQQTDKALMFGLSETDIDDNYTTIDYAIQLHHSGIFYVYESGTFKIGIGPYQIGDVFAIRRTGTAIEYLRNDVVFYSSSVASSGELLVDVSIYHQGGSIVLDNFSLFETRSTALDNVHEYDNASFPYVNDADEYLTVTYYDDYTFDFALNNTYTAKLGSGDYNTNVKGLPTGSKVKNLSDTTWMEGVSYYDDKYRMIQLISENQFGLQDTMSIEYNFIGRAKKTEYLHHHSSGSRSVYRFFDYDHLGRLNHIKHSVDDANEANAVILSSHEYNRIGALMDKKLHSTDGTDFMQSMDFAFNIRGWLTAINSADLNDSDGNDFFGFELSYQNQDNGLNNTVAWNGNISAIKYSNYVGTEGVTQRAYNFEYDDMNRLKSAQHNEYSNTSWANVSAFSVSDIDYDMNGNILSLIRKEETGINMDELTYTYANNGVEGNQLITVTDLGITDKGFVDGSDESVQYEYDQNGNMIKDLNKGINNIEYNHLNLPEKVDMGDGNYIEYSYNAVGGKQQQKVYENDTLRKTTDYAGEFIYEDSVLTVVHHEEGRLVPEPDGSLTYQYHMRDHLGNVRLTFTSGIYADTLVATMEDSLYSMESALFNNMDNRVLFPPPPAGDKATMLNNANPFGPSYGTRVSKGDTIDMSVKIYYEGLSGFGTVPLNLSQMSALIAGAFGDGTISTEAQTVYDYFSGANTAGSALLGGSSGDDEIPSAYLSYLLFNANDSLIQSGFVGAVSGANLIQTRSLQNLVINEPGYIFIYVTNESNSANPVYFDDLTVIIKEGPVLETTDYYPFGLTFNEYSKPGMFEQNFKYNGVEQVKDLGMNLNMTSFRPLDPALGRWLQADPIHKFHESPYAWVTNNPIRFADPFGLDTLSTDDANFDWSNVKQGDVVDGVVINGTILTDELVVTSTKLPEDNNDESDDSEDGEDNNPGPYDPTFDPSGGSHDFVTYSYPSFLNSNGSLSGQIRESGFEITKNSTYNQLAKRSDQFQGMSSSTSNLFYYSIGVQGGKRIAKEVVKDLNNQATINKSLNSSSIHSRTIKVPGFLRFIGRFAGLGFSAWSVIDVQQQYENREITSFQAGAEQTSNFIGAVPVIGNGWSIGWEIGRTITKIPSYQKWKRNTWLPWRRDVLGY